MADPNTPYVGPIEAAGWNLYDITRLAYPHAAGQWNHLQRFGPVAQVVEGGRYVLAPQPEPGQSLADANAQSNLIGLPHLRICDYLSPDYPGLRVQYSDKFALVGYLTVSASRVRLYSPKLQLPYIHDMVELHPTTGPEIFARDFGIMALQEFMLKRKDSRGF